jgi:hypothetical protein
LFVVPECRVLPIRVTLARLNRFARLRRENSARSRLQQRSTEYRSTPRRSTQRLVRPALLIPLHAVLLAAELLELPSAEIPLTVVMTTIMVTDIFRVFADSLPDFLPDITVLILITAMVSVIPTAAFPP